MRTSSLLAGMVIIAASCCAVPVFAQDNDYNGLMAMDDSGLQRELTLRYDAGLAASMNDSIIAADDPRYLWALETKVQCGIALGFMRSSTRDETSIRNCAMAYARMQQVPGPPPARMAPPAQVAQPPVRRPDNCNDALVATVFFDFDMAEVTPAAGAILDTVGQQVRACGWSRLSVVGHTDQAGSDAYNMALSRARADAVAAALRGRDMGSTGIDVGAQGESNPRVPLADGTRSPQNRRVEISAN